MDNLKESSDLKKINIDGQDYDFDAITERGHNLIKSIKRVEAEVHHLMFQKSIAELAYSKLMDELQNEIPKFAKADEVVKSKK